MSFLRTVLLFVASAVLLATPPLSAQTAHPPGIDVFLNRLAPGATLDRFLDAVRTEFRQLDADGNGEISAVDIAAHDAVVAAGMRATEAMRLMSADLDGDGAVTEDELRRKLRYDRRTSLPPPGMPSAVDQIEQEVLRLRAADADKDGRVTWVEAIDAVKNRPNYAATIASGFGQRIRQLLELASDGKQAVRLPEIEKVTEAAFRAVDTDGNGTISQDEVEAARRARQQVMRKRDDEKRAAERQRKEAEQEVACAMPKASENAKVIVLGAYETESLSTVAIGSQDKVTHAGNIVVEPGGEPLYVVAATYASVVWRFSGALDRVERVVLGRQSGATGLSPERVTILSRQDCLPYFSEAPSLQSAKTTAFVTRAAGKAPDGIFGRYEPSTFSVPSGQIHAISANGGPRILVIQKSAGSLRVETDRGGVIVQTPSTRNLESELRRFSPGGVVEIDPGTIVVSLPVSRYEVLPQQAGLIQLMQTGALSQNRLGEFLIHKKIRFPAGLAGAHSVKFLLLRGVPMPEGDPGHSPVVSEETGESLRFETKN